MTNEKQLLVGKEDLVKLVSKITHDIRNNAQVILFSDDRGTVNKNVIEIKVQSEALAKLCTDYWMEDFKK